MIPLVGTPKELASSMRAGDRRRSRRGARTSGVELPLLSRHHDRAAARLPAGRPDRRGRRLLQLRHQRPDPDDPRPLAATTPGASSRRLPRAPGIFEQRSLRQPSTATAWASWSRSPSSAAARPAPTSSSASAASTAATRPRSASARRSAWTTSPARPTACRSRAGGGAGRLTGDQSGRKGEAPISVEIPATLTPAPRSAGRIPHSRTGGRGGSFRCWARGLRKGRRGSAKELLSPCGRGSVRVDVSPLADLRAGGKPALASRQQTRDPPRTRPYHALLTEAYLAPLGQVIGPHRPARRRQIHARGRPGIGAFRAQSEERRRHRRRSLVAAHRRRAAGRSRAAAHRSRGPEHVFIRSMAARDQLGGLAEITFGAMVLMRAVYDVVLVETVGVGQSETDISMAADTVVFCVQPGSGDSLHS